MAPRISIRKQFSILLILFSGLGLGILAGVTWNYAQQYVLDVAKSRLSLMAQYKSSQIAYNLELILTASTFVTTRAILQDALYNYQRFSLDGISGAQSDLQATLGAVGPLYQPIVLQARVFAPNASSPTGIAEVMNATGLGAENIVVPSYDGMPSAILGFADGGYPSELYPNLTIQSNNSNVAVFQNKVILPTSSLILGPTPVNATFSLLSITLPVVNTTERTNVLGWVTVLTSSRMITSVLSDADDLGTGQALLFGSTNATNQFPVGVIGTAEAADALITFQLPANPTSTIKHTDSNSSDSWDSGFAAKKYPIVQDCLQQNNRMSDSVLSNLDTTNELGLHVAASAALVPSDLVDWVVVIEQPRENVLAPTTALRNIILACLFSFFGFLIIVSIPLAYWAVRPIIRLRHAAEGSTDSSDDASSKEGSYGSSSVDEKRHSTSPQLRKRNWTALLPWKRKINDPPAQETHSQIARSRIPAEVPLGKVWIEDEMIDLIRKFNEMARELRGQYEMLEDRVRQRTLELEQSKKAAEAANESKTIFLANVSHELRTPLNGILGLCSVSMEEEDPKNLQHSLLTISKSGELLYRTLSDLLTFSTNQVGYQQVKLEENEFDMDDLKQQVIAIFAEQARERHIRLQFKFENETLANTVAWGDLHRILQIIINLVSNGLKFTPENGCVSVAVSQLTADPDLDLKFNRSVSMNEEVSGTANFVKLDGSRARNSMSGPSSTGEKELHIRIQVTDSGPGIPEKSQKTIFEPFMQADAGLNRKHSGTGLGLAICSQLCTLMRGSISVTSTVGRGSTFTVDLPLRRVAVKPPAIPQQPRMADTNLLRRSRSADNPPIRQPDPVRPAPMIRELSGNRSERSIKPGKPDYSQLRILVAEDNKVNTEVILRMLSLEGVPNTNVALAINGQIAFEEVQAGTAFDIIFMDIQMPELDGHQSTKKIRQLGVTTPIVALTAFAEQSNVEECYSSGMDFFLAKPVKRALLRDVLQKYCSELTGNKEGIS